MALSPRTKEAIAFLNSIKPTDGYSIGIYQESATKNRKVSLRRRNVLLHDETGFNELVWDTKSGGVVGIQVSLEEQNRGMGLMLVESDGTVCIKQRAVNVVLHEPSKTPDRLKKMKKARKPQNQTLSDEDSAKLLQYGMYAIGGLIALQVFSSILPMLLVIMIPALAYASTTLPPDESFDAKKEIKRVLRGVHLNDDNPNKPKGWFEETVARVTASVTTELSTTVAGYEVEFTHFALFATYVRVHVIAAKCECYWVGAFGKWWFLRQVSVAPPPSG